MTQHDKQTFILVSSWKITDIHYYGNIKTVSMTQHDKKTFILVSSWKITNIHYYGNIKTV